ncbi:HD-GYP domain-containing protein [Paenibacillus antri]|uniref:HD-GYP domain-containing protein n=1 Tax=Paenibacillus antri TaxID=2582848 RepID=A0A5R9G2W9_9BACL|nr:HD-GYP domain-containing protein [Paenibacillus antri]TLS50702.1 HD-GYP domain-containing protein [Paenibacillus antri]
MELEERESIQRCMQGQAYCPVNLPRAIWFWVAFALVSAASAAANLIWRDPALPTLFAIPAIYLGLIRIPVPAFAAANAASCALIAFVAERDAGGIVTAAAFLAVSCLVRRVAATSFRHYSQKRQYEELFMDTMLSFAKSIDTRDPYTAFHSRNVAGYAKRIAEELKLPAAQTEAVYLAGLIHDIGKIGTPEHILSKESRLTEEEYEIMKRHPEAGYDIVKNIARLQELGIADMVRHHHERVDGKGYPHGLRGDAIPLGARILAAADAFDAMTTNRSYRQKLAVETAAEELRRHSGTQFDPAVAEAFLRTLARDGKLQAQESPRGQAAPAQTAAG